MIDSGQGVKPCFFVFVMATRCKLDNNAGTIISVALQAGHDTFLIYEWRVPRQGRLLGKNQLIVSDLQLPSLWVKTQTYYGYFSH